MPRRDLYAHKTEKLQREHLNINGKMSLSTPMKARCTEEAMCFTAGNSVTKHVYPIQHKGSTSSA